MRRDLTRSLAVAAVVAAVAACGPSDADRARARHRAEQEAATQREIAREAQRDREARAHEAAIQDEFDNLTLEADRALHGGDADAAGGALDVLPEAPDPDLVAAPPTACVPAGAATSARLAGRDLQLCLDTSGDGEGDVCVDVDRGTGAVQGPRAATVAERGGARAWRLPLRADVEDEPVQDGVPSVLVVDDRVEVCAADRACVTVAPRLAAGQTLEHAEARGDGGVVALGITEDGAAEVIEVWDLQRGRRRARFVAPGKGDVDDAPNLGVVGDAVLVAHIDADDLATITAVDLDGKRPHLLAGGAPVVQDALVLDRRTVALWRLPPDDDDDATGGTLIVQNVATGAIVRQVALPDQGDDDELVVAAPRTVVAIGTIDDRVRLDVVDVGAGRVQRITAARCP
ncbi:MAG: hypothetical protein H6708_34125 [Kofleriaceae bacterium]|nr:hypothetical protein [Kofleriaceae bacterium]